MTLDPLARISTLAIVVAQLLWMVSSQQFLAPYPPFATQETVMTIIWGQENASSPKAKLF